MPTRTKNVDKDTGYHSKSFLTVPLKNHEDDVIFASTILLESLGVDIIVSNQSFNLWQKSMQLSGYLKGPTNFYFASSPELNKLLQPYQNNIQNIHMVRGDGDGPVNLFSE